MIPTRFGTYEFPRDKVVRFSDNFRNLNTSMTPVIGAPGGVDQFGLAAAPAREGRVTVTYWIRVSDQNQMAVELTRLGALAAWGRKNLWRETWDGHLEFCSARLAEAPITHAYRKFPQLRLEITLTFDVPNPVWYRIWPGTALWGRFKWGDGSKWGVGSQSYTLSGLTTTLNIPYMGNTPTPLRMYFTVSFSFFQNLVIRREVEGRTADQMTWLGTVNSATLEDLLIDPRRKIVQKRGANVISGFTPQTAEWMMLVPGTNRMVILQENAVALGAVRLYYLEAYR